MPERWRPKPNIRALQTYCESLRSGNSTHQALAGLAIYPKILRLPHPVHRVRWTHRVSRPYLRSTAETNEYNGSHPYPSPIASFPKRRCRPDHGPAPYRASSSPAKPRRFSGAGICAFSPHWIRTCRNTLKDVFPVPEHPAPCVWLHLPPLWISVLPYSDRFKNYLVYWNRILIRHKYQNIFHFMQFFRGLYSKIRILSTWHP